MELLLLALPPILGFLVGRYWIVPTLGAGFVLFVAVAAIVDNYVGACTRPDGCGAGPVAQAVALGVLAAILIAALAALGVLVRQRRVHRTEALGDDGPR